MRLIALVVFACCVAAGLSEERRRYDGHQLLRIHPRGKAQLDFVYSNQDDPEMDYWYEGKERVDILVAPSRIAQFKAQLSSKDIFYTVENADIQKDIDEEVERLMKKQSEPNRAFDYDDFNTFTDIIAELDALVARCPPTVSCETFVIGQSYEGRDLKGLKIFRTGSNRQAIWLDATIHAREWLATATHLKIVKHLIDDYQDVQVSDLLATYDFYLIPVNNPDGYTYTHTTERLWRKSRNPNSGSACIGTDLNRNYDQMWGNAGASTSPCSDTYRGSSAGSEPETQAVQSALRSVGSSLFMSLHFHTYGPYWLIPWGSVNPDGSCNYANDHDEMYYVANIVADAIQNTYNQDRWLRGNSCDTIYPASGITMDYSKGVAGVKYTVTPELRGNSFIVSNTQIQPSFVEVWNGVLTMVRTIEGLEKK